MRTRQVPGTTRQIMKVAQFSERTSARLRALSETLLDLHPIGGVNSFWEVTRFSKRRQHGARAVPLLLYGSVGRLADAGSGFVYSTRMDEVIR